MPGLNRKGPMNEGPMTGRKTGLCNPDSPLRKQKDEPTEVNNDQLQGRGLGLGLGRGARRGGRGTGAGAGRGRGMGRGRGIGMGRS